jgi:RNA polymerase sigma-70 factor (ECF subfamily)
MEPKRPDAAGSEPMIGGSPHRPSVSRHTLEGVRRREREALGELFERYVDYLFGLACRLLGDRHAAEEAIQNVFLKVHRAADQLDPARDPGPWLVTITYNHCREQQRSWSAKLSRRSRSIHDDRAPLVGELRDAGRDPEALALANEMEERLTRAIDTLPESMRAVVLLHDYRGLTHEEAAVVLGTTPAAVRKRYSRALAALRQRLEETPE